MLNDNLADGVVDDDEHEKVSSQERGGELKGIFININVYFIFILFYITSFLQYIILTLRHKPMSHSHATICARQAFS